MVRSRLLEFGAETVFCDILLLSLIVRLQSAYHTVYELRFVYATYIFTIYTYPLILSRGQNITNGMLFASWFDAPRDTRAQLTLLQRAHPHTQYQLFLVCFLFIQYFLYVMIIVFV